MKKCLFVFLCCLGGMINPLSSQRISMIDLPVPLDTLVKNFYKKGFTLKTKSAESTILLGKVNDEPVEMIIYPTAMTKLVRKVTLKYPPHKKWKSLKKAYTERLTMMIEKYGPIKFQRLEFLPPYKEGKGKEFEALAKQKAFWITNWGDMPYNQNLFLELEASADKCILIHFTLKDHAIKHEEEKKMSQNSLF